MSSAEYEIYTSKTRDPDFFAITLANYVLNVVRNILYPTLKNVIKNNKYGYFV